MKEQHMVNMDNQKEMNETTLSNKNTQSTKNASLVNHKRENEILLLKELAKATYYKPLQMIPPENEELDGGEGSE